MKEPSLDELNNIRKEGFRPGVVACIISDSKLLMFYKIEHKLWQLPQGRINNKENPKEALKRNLDEELGADFTSKLNFDEIEFFEVDKMEFKPGRHEVEKLYDDDGREINMLGKVYYFCTINALSPEIDIKKTQYDEHFWVTYKEAYFLSDRIYQKGKRRITLKVVSDLHTMGKIA